MTTGALYMDAVITPNRSLSRRGIKVVILSMGAMSLIPMTMAIILGAPFPPLFLGLDVLGLWLALHIATRPGRLRSERVQVSSEAVRVLQGFKGRERPVWDSPTAFTRVEVEGEGDELRVWLRLSARSLTVAAALSPDERGAFGEALKEAMRNARLERHPL
ncbi:MAG: hypothetical protein JWO33_548 [Caulobacteraceae bacterium]|nr:hypothetical protein [Caulobacteraceae bacterium]